MQNANVQNKYQVVVDFGNNNIFQIQDWGTAKDYIHLSFADRFVLGDVGAMGTADFRATNNKTIGMSMVLKQNSDDALKFAQWLFDEETTEVDFITVEVKNTVTGEKFVCQQGVLSNTSWGVEGDDNITYKMIFLTHQHEWNKAGV